MKPEKHVTKKPTWFCINLYEYNWVPQMKQREVYTSFNLLYTKNCRTIISDTNLYILGRASFYSSIHCQPKGYS